MLSKLKKIRLLANFSQQEVAKKLGISQPTYQRWESGTSQIPPSKLGKLAKVLGVTVAEMEGAPPPFDYLGYDRDFEDDRRYFGEVAFHFVGGSSLLLPISIAQRDSLVQQLENSTRFPIVSSLDNRTVVVHTKAVSDVFFSSEAYDDFGPEHDSYEHGPGIYPDDDFWEIVEHLELPERLDEFPVHRVKEVLAKVELTDEELDKLIWDGTVPSEDRSEVRHKADALTSQFGDFATYVFWQLKNGKTRTAYIEDDYDIYAMATALNMLDAEETDILHIAAEGYHRTVFVNPDSINYLTCPSHRFNRGMVQEREQLIDQSR
jgi:transcriptional regulator with XRE-family HTH domain